MLFYFMGMPLFHSLVLIYKLQKKMLMFIERRGDSTLDIFHYEKLTLYELYIRCLLKMSLKTLKNARQFLYMPLHT